MNVVASAEASTMTAGLIGFGVTTGFVIALLVAADWLLLRRNASDLSTEERVPRQVLMTVLTVLGLAAAIVALPVGTDKREILIGVFGLIVSAVIALSSTTFIANVMAGLMLRSVDNFTAGDFVRVGDQFGRVTERGLFHTEIQTEDRDLTTLPNLYLVQHPLTVVRKSGTIVSTQLSLGYDLPHAKVEPLLKQAAERCELADAFVQVLELGDYAVTYRVAGFLGDPKQLLSTRSKLRKHVLDCLHGAGVEIVSPHFVNQRRAEEPVVAPPTPAPPATSPDEGPEPVIFDKAELAAEEEDLLKQRKTLVAEIAALEASKDIGQAGELDRMRKALSVLDHRIERSQTARKNEEPN